MNFLVFSSIVLGLVSGIAGLQCYSCEGRDNELCGRNPTQAGRVTCANNELCNVLRTERTGPSGTTVTYSRGCRQSAFAGAVSNNGGSMSTTSQSCSYDLCNTGDAMASSINFPNFSQNYNSASTDYPGWVPLLALLSSALMAAIYYV